MKKLAIGLLMTGLTFQAFAQDVLFEAKLKKEDVPVVVTQAIEEDFPGYSVLEYDAVPLDFVGEDVIVDKNINSVDDYSTYEIKLQANGRELDAIYDSNGKLMSKYEYLKNVAPPKAVTDSIVKIFPGWGITKDNYKMTHYVNEKPKERYKLILTKGKQKMRVYTDSKGNILKVS